jgi:hypothetical protein
MVSDRPLWLPAVGQTIVNCTDAVQVVKGFLVNLVEKWGLQAPLFLMGGR